jgi:hypothetical protein
MDLGGRGVETFGLMMRLWSADPKGYNRGCSPEDVALARQIASQLDIPLTLIDVCLCQSKTRPFDHRKCYHPGLLSLDVIIQNAPT